MKRLSADFYARPVVEVARDLIGCTVAHGATSGMIVETEAYHESEPACHAYKGPTRRAAVLFGSPGIAYVYRSYGIHALLNAVCESEGVGAAVLIRALAPQEGVVEMRECRGLSPIEEPVSTSADALRQRELCSGPGRLTQALDIDLSLNGSSLVSGPIAISAGERAGTCEVVAAARIGITKAAELPWRFCLAGDVHVSRPWPSRRATPPPTLGSRRS
ncbi:MAG: DNA-3-methyladenine glycosylase [Dehalococcoidia bacterium]